MKSKCLIDLNDLTTQDIEELLILAKNIKDNPEEYMAVCNGKIMASLFFEPSTRTRLSFEAAMKRLGGDVIGFSDVNSSSVSKGETLADTIRTVAGYSDLIVMRHFSEGGPKYATLYTDKPVINAGDGSHQHPTQTLGDLFTISESKGRIDNLKVGFVGDLKFGRTVHSLIMALTKYKNIELFLVSPDELRIPEYVRTQIIEKNNMTYTEVERLEDVIGELDILYMTRVQKERFFNEADYIRLKDSYILDTEKMKLAKGDLAVLHPLPRVNEITPEVDKDSRAWYFRQTEYAMYMRMALIMKVLEV